MLIGDSAEIWLITPGQDAFALTIGKEYLRLPPFPIPHSCKTLICALDYWMIGYATDYTGYSDWPYAITDWRL